MTTKGEWVAYTGNDEQISELESAEKGYILRCFYSDGDETYETPIMFGGIYDDEDSETFTSKIVVAYWIIPDDPLREMKIRQAMTGQPVWVKEREMKKTGFPLGYKYYATTTPNWNIPNAEYSFTAFEE